MIPHLVIPKNMSKPECSVPSDVGDKLLILPENTSFLGHLGFNFKAGNTFHPWLTKKGLLLNLATITYMCHPWIYINKK
jgi:hypothetical protein